MGDIMFRMLAPLLRTDKRHEEHFRGIPIH